MPRFSGPLVSLAKKLSTALSQDADFGVEWKVGIRPVRATLRAEGECRKS